MTVNKGFYAATESVHEPALYLEAEWAMPGHGFVSVSFSLFRFDPKIDFVCLEDTLLKGQ